MKVSEAIAILEDVLVDEGDLDLVMLTESGDHFNVDRFFELEIVGLPVADNETAEEIVVGVISLRDGMTIEGEQ